MISPLGETLEKAEPEPQPDNRRRCDFAQIPARRGRQASLRGRPEGPVDSESRFDEYHVRSSRRNVSAVCSSI